MLNEAKRDENNTKFSLTFESKKSYVQSESCKSSIDNPLKVVIPNDGLDSPPLYKEDNLSEHNSELDYLEDDSLPCPFNLDDFDNNDCGDSKQDVNTHSSPREEKEELPITPSRPKTPPRVSPRKRPNYRVESPSFNSSYHLKFTPTMSHRKLVNMQRSSSQSISQNISESKSSSFLRSDSGIFCPPSPTTPRNNNNNNINNMLNPPTTPTVDVDSPFTIHTKRSLSCSAENYARYMMPITLEELKAAERMLDEDMAEAEEERKKEELEELEDVEMDMFKMIEMINIKKKGGAVSDGGGDASGSKSKEHHEYDEQGRRIPFPLKDNNIETLREYILNPLPSNTAILKCCISREKHMSGNVYHVSLDYPHDHTYLLSCKKNINSKTSYYAVSMSDSDFVEPHYHLGKVRLHVNPTYYSIYSNGKNPTRTDQKELVRDEMGIVFYNSPNDSPPDIFAVLPNVVDDISEKITDTSSGTLYTRICNDHYNDFIILRSRKPVWSPEHHGHIMPFGGRVTKPSTKNFQLLQVPFGNETVLQFGRTGDDSFIFDLKHPLSIYQGLCIIMSVIDQNIGDRHTEALVEKLATLFPAPTRL